MIVSVMFSGVIINMRKHLDWLYSAQLVACLAHVAVIVALLSFQLIFDTLINYSMFMIKYEYQ